MLARQEGEVLHVVHDGDEDDDDGVNLEHFYNSELCIALLSRVQKYNKAFWTMDSFNHFAILCLQKVKLRTASITIRSLQHVFCN